jgi:hypothetical protein
MNTTEQVKTVEQVSRRASRLISRVYLYLGRDGAGAYRLLDCTPYGW